MPMRKPIPVARRPRKISIFAHALPSLASSATRFSRGSLMRLCSSWLARQGKKLGNPAAEIGQDPVAGQLFVFLYNFFLHARPIHDHVAGVRIEYPYQLGAEAELLLDAP